MPTLNLDGHEVYGYEIDFILCYKDDKQTDNFLEADEFTVVLTDEGRDRLETAEVYVTRDELDSSTYELILECIQPT
ncbi:hypothetical protein [Nostoc sp. ChiVER01]|uniref:hypothetical protein n=1 Tax=Nostoc sp. ChiVER01 TaxID=3075382 RepID=UPI002AD29C59|nr:hypothetical protein [Nostoc sp. ChiVER01]MDZ8221850.1 hypothetical protein [Nostoc sp. ChiVER01]